MSKKNNNHKKDRFTIFLGLLSLLEVFRFFKKKKNKKIKDNFIKFLRKEEDEIEKLVEGKENPKEFAEKSTNIFKDFFIPTKDNHYKPRIFHTKTLIATGLILASLKFILASYLFFIYPYQARMNEFFNDQLLSLINKDRVSQNLGTLEFNDVLNISAMNKAKDLVQNNYFAHVSPDGRKPWDWINRDNYRYLLVGENLAMNFTTPESVHKALMLSPSHKKNILNGKYRDIGLAVLDGNIDGEDTTVLVELFSLKKEEQLRTASLASADIKISEDEVETNNIEQKTILKTKTVSSFPLSSEIKPKVEATSPKEEKNNIEKVKNKNKEENEKKIKESQNKLILPPPPPAPPSLSKIASIVKEDSVTPQAKVLSSISTKEDIVEVQDNVHELARANSVSGNIESNNLYQTKVFSNNKNDAKVFAETKLKYFNYFLFVILLVISVFLTINIIIRIEVQHKHVLLQTIFLIIFIVGLISLKFDFLSSVLPKILIV